MQATIMFRRTLYSASRQRFGRNISLSAVNRDTFTVQTPQDFEEKVKNSKVPVIIDFFATWCNPCKMLTPRLESVIDETKGKVNLAKVDIDEHTDLALDYDVSAVPVLLAMRNGKEQQRLVGLQDADVLKKWVNQLIAEEDKVASKR